MVVFPSLHEGFGLPVIEAQAMGRPLITTRLTSLPEVAGSGAHYVDDPLDAEELRLAINKIIGEEVYRNNLINEGYKNVSRFTWPVMRETYYHVYKNILST
jgi:glycosyltransferase involved in cell wall biosynthesis